MAKRTITHFKVGSALFNDITGMLLELPARASRELLNRIESKAECEPIFKVDIQAKKKAGKKKARKTVAKRKRSA
jgi:hypothetical protein